jgi:electron transfer flavoprotein alpha subunit
MSNVLIVAEQQDGKLRRATLSAVTFGKKAAELSGGKMLVLVAGKDTSAAAQELATFGGAGVTEVLAVDDPALEPYMAETWAPLVARVAKEKGATIVAATATAVGKDLAPRLAHLLDAAVASDIVGVVGKNVFRRMVYAGNLIAEVEITTPSVVVTCRQTEFDAPAPGGAAAPVSKLQAGALEPLGAKVEGFDKTASARPELTEARVVVSGGRA